MATRTSTAEIKAATKRVCRRRYRTIRDYASALIQLVARYDDDGHEIGYDYGWIRAMVIRKFPTVRFGGPHTGQPTKMPYRELQEISSALNRGGLRLPFRIRRKVMKRRVG